MKRLFFLASMLLTVMAISAQTLNETIDVIKKVNDKWQKEHPAPLYGGGREDISAFWDNAVYHTGNMEAFMLYPNKEWYDYSLAWAEKNDWQGAKEKDPTKWKYSHYGEGQDFVLFGDWQICFQTYIDLYNFSGKRDEKMVARAKEVMGYIAHSDKNDYWWWCDALYMVMPVMTKMYLLTGDVAYLDKMYENWKYANSIMYDKQTGLYFRDGKYVYPKHKSVNGKKDFWARGDGWVMAAFAKVLKDMPKDYKHRKEFVKYYKKMAAGVLAAQRSDGYWTRSMLDPEHAPGYETSGTALMCYSLFWGINNGYLPETYLQSATNAWHYLYNVALQKDYSIGYVQPIGERAIPGQVVNQKSVTNFGTGAFLLAAAEYCRFLQSR